MGVNFCNLQNLSQDLSELIITKRKDYNCHLATLNDRQSSPKNFWKILKTFYNGNKIPIPLITVNDKFVSDYEENANHFNKFCASQFTPIDDNDSKILCLVVFNIEARLCSTTCEDNDILKIIKNLDISKAHDFDDISFRTVKLCDDLLGAGGGF